MAILYSTGDITFIVHGSKDSCPLFQKKTLFLDPMLLSYTNSLKRKHTSDVLPFDINEESSPNTCILYFLENNNIDSLHWFKYPWFRKHIHKHFLFLWQHTSEPGFANPILQMSILSLIDQIILGAIALTGKAGTSVQVFCLRIYYISYRTRVFLSFTTFIGNCM